MQQIDTVVYRILILGILGVTGYIFGKTGYFPENSDTFLSRFIVKLTTPALILTTLAGYNFTRETLVDGVLISCLAVLAMFLSLLLSIGLSALLKLDEAKSKIFRMHLMLGNVGFIGMPLLGEVFGQKGLVYAMFYVIPHDLLLWTVGIYVLGKKKGTGIRESLRNLVNANTIAYAIGLVFILINFQRLAQEYKPLGWVYKLLDNAFSPLANITVYLTMLFIGLTLSKISVGGFSDVFRRYPTYILVFLKLVGIPLGVFCLLNVFGGWIDSFVKTIVVLELAMPCSILVTALSGQYDGDTEFATENVFFSTLLTVFTLPFIMHVIL